MRGRMVFILILIMLSMTLINSCRNRKKGSRVATTSDRLKEFSYELEGELKLSTDRDIYLYAHLVDLLRKKADHPDDLEEGAKIDKIVSDIKTLTESFNEAYREGFPIVNSQGQVDRSKIRYWIARQIRFSTAALKEKNLALTLNKTNEKVDMVVENKGDHITVKYRAVFLGTTQNDYRSTWDAKLKPGDTLSLPQDPIAVYFQSITPDITDVYRRGLSAIKGQGEPFDDAVNDLETHLSVTRNLGGMMPTTCNIFDGDAISPFNYFYYFDSSRAGCSADLSIARVTAVNELPVKTTYPEYHRLFADNKLDFFIYYNKVDTEAPLAAKNLARFLQKNKYSLVTFDLAWIGGDAPRTPAPEDLFSSDFIIRSYKYAKSINGIIYRTINNSSGFNSN